MTFLNLFAAFYRVYSIDHTPMTIMGEGNIFTYLFRVLFIKGPNHSLYDSFSFSLLFTFLFSRPLNISYFYWYSLSIYFHSSFVLAVYPFASTIYYYFAFSALLLVYLNFLLLLSPSPTLSFSYNSPALPFSLAVLFSCFSQFIRSLSYSLTAPLLPYLPVQQIVSLCVAKI